MASGTSKKTELKLTGVARASLEELLLDYEDFLRQRDLRQWDRESTEAMRVRRRYQTDGPGESKGRDPYGFADASLEQLANTLICLINQASFLLHRQLSALEKSFAEEGGFTERLYRERSRIRRNRGRE